jgi:hypothetical protein
VLGPIETRGLVRTLRQQIGVPDFIWHGIKHIVESKLAELRVPPHIRDMLLDHSAQRGAGKGYDHHEYRAERLEALEVWCSHIEDLVQPSEGVAVLR